MGTWGLVSRCDIWGLGLQEAASPGRPPQLLQCPVGQLGTLLIPSRRQASALPLGDQTHAHSLQLISPCRGSVLGQRTRIRLLPGLPPPDLALRTPCMQPFTGDPDGTLATPSVGQSTTPPFLLWGGSSRTLSLPC